jgi:hypothetical protein
MSLKITRCFNCSNYIEKKNKFICLAFADGIPDEILLGENDHSKPLPEQGNDIVFEPADNRLTQ